MWTDFKILYQFIRKKILYAYPTKISSSAIVCLCWYTTTLWNSRGQTFTL